MLDAKDFRDEARSALSGSWGIAVGTGLVASLLGAGITAVNYGGTSGSSDLLEIIANSGVLGDLAKVLFVVSLVIALISSLFASVLGLVRFVIGGAISLGYVKFNLDLIDKKEVQFSDIFSQFGLFGQAFLMQLLRSIFTTLWSLLFIFPGVVAAYSYAMAPYILYENPEMSGLDAITRSKELMDGNKWRLFCLDLSFIGWDLLCVLTFGIGFLWLAPYKQAANAAFYREITAAINHYRRNEEEGNESW